MMTMLNEDLGNHLIHLVEQTEEFDERLSGNGTCL
jgi:hypothetical protein